MKILIIRFSSIGDIVLTTPIVRCLYHHIENVELHYLCKTSFAEIMASSPYLHKIHRFNKGDKSLIKTLKTEKFDYVVDLQKNRFSRKICRQLHVRHSSFPKLNIRKWILVNFKINLMPNLHVVDRYFKALKELKVVNDGKGLDFFTTEEDKTYFKRLNLPKVYVAIAIGSKHKTKQIPKNKLLKICRKITHPVVFLGDKDDSVIAEYVMQKIDNKAYNMCGKTSIRQSALCVQYAICLLTGDTGLMHIAAALNQKIISVWGNTVPAFGMYPYMPENEDKYTIVEVHNLYCRPCSKLGFKRCPQSHFRCMLDIPIDDIVLKINE